MSDLFLDEVIRPEPQGGGGRRASRRGGREDRERERRRRRRRGVIALVVSFALLIGGGFAVWKLVGPMIDDFRDSRSQPEAEDFAGPGHGSVDVTIESGATGGQMGQVLAEAGVVASQTAFTRAFAANPDAAGIQPGTYRLMLGMPAAEAVGALLDTSNRVQTRVTIPEGLRVTQILDRLSSVTTVPVEEFQTAMADTAATGLPAEAGGNYEGWLFASTYSFEPGTTPTEMIAAMVAETVKVLDERGVAPQDRQRVLTIASLVEREARSAEDKAKVARAIQNRLDIDMKLDIDAAVAYGLNKPGTELTRDDTANSDTPYNLYRYAGLPPTPIASPSLIAIDAVLAPADGPWLFWVTVNLDTGETRFAETFAEHQQNIALLRQWEAEQG
ncbi:endolytic transglycosylase MltG [Cellulomonas carbonis]|uniref:Endolytic murein transglycosylase n=1 Tax=Cellulomonas carbonis T26 TaxID=947969 RepID=A0A0A0BM82_9CELL|nr:endolytic transglycosylase MltG [Cellulomonas carbonis]KGM08777.1 aminodeoxychorismate lyase [Cellulomonas carbonis T26]GGB94022.1 ABC transporter substrate-binding protein [Cellulomonas carbonis]